jgi:hypothetical protein
MIFQKILLKNRNIIRTMKKRSKLKVENNTYRDIRKEVMTL